MTFPSTSTSTRQLVNPISYWSKRVLYADRGIIVLNKPSGLICQTENDDNAYSPDSTRTSFSECLDSKLSSNLTPQAYHPTGLRQNFSLSCNPYPVHRLDKVFFTNSCSYRSTVTVLKGTTGTLLLAKTLQSAQSISQQLQQRTVEKFYLALVRGGDKSFPVKSGVINVPLQYHNGTASLARKGKSSLTEWEVLASSPVAPLTLLRFKLMTGNKHQLRVHAAQSLLAPILGDHVYSKTAQSPVITTLTQVPEDRMYLHAHEVSFFKYRPSGPHKRFRLSIRAPLPHDFSRICADMKMNVNSSDSRGGILVNGVHADEGQDVINYCTKE
ncbi:Pseudouridine synthase [Amanita muscaria]